MPEVQTPQFLISNLSLPLALTAAGSVAAHERYIDSVGADGIELTPMQIGHFMGMLLHRADMLENPSAHPAPTDGWEFAFDQGGYCLRSDWAEEDAAFKRLIRAQHSSFRGMDDNGLVARAVPDWRTSLKQMSQIQRITGVLPAVLYPWLKDGVVYSGQNAPFGERTLQPKAREWHQMGLTESSSARDVMAALQARGFTGLTWDVLHCQVEDEGEGFRDPLDLAGRMAAAGLIRYVHLSVNRLDITGLHSPLAERTKYARKAFKHSAATAGRTLEGEMLVVINEEIVNQGRAKQASAADTDARSIPDPEITALEHVVLEDGPLRFGRAKPAQAAIIAHARELIAA